MINRNTKIALIHVAKKQLGLDSEEYISILMGAANIQTARELETEQQYSSIMKAFRQLGFNSNQKFQNPNFKQITYIRLLWAHVSNQKDSKSLDVFCNRITGKNLYLLQKEQATDVINALRKMAINKGLNPDSL